MAEAGTNLDRSFKSTDDHRQPMTTEAEPMTIEDAQTAINEAFKRLVWLIFTPNFILTLSSLLSSFLGVLEGNCR